MEILSVVCNVLLVVDNVRAYGVAASCPRLVPEAGHSLLIPGLQTWVRIEERRYHVGSHWPFAISAINEELIPLSKVMQRRIHTHRSKSERVDALIIIISGPFLTDEAFHHWNLHIMEVFAAGQQSSTVFPTPCQVALHEVACVERVHQPFCKRHVLAQTDRLLHFRQEPLEVHVRGLRRWGEERARGREDMGGGRRRMSRMSRRTRTTSTTGKGTKM